jgi:hypothetical protein
MLTRTIAGLASIALASTLAVQLFDARDALRLGRSQDDAVYAAFSKGYQLTPADPIASAEIITEFRRAVLIVREHALQGQFGFSERDLDVAMKPHLGRITFVAQISLHPLNTYQRVPAYEMYVSTGAQTAPVAAPTITREPQYALGGPGSALIGIRLEITVPRAAIAAAAAPELIVTDEHADVVWRSDLDLSRFR